MANMVKKHLYHPDETMEFDKDNADNWEEKFLENEKTFLRKSQQLEDLKSDDSEYEVMALNEDEDMDENFILPSDKAWGKKKKMYYSTDYVDADYASASRKDTIDAELEEQEARNIQKRLAQQLDETDFCLDNIKNEDYDLHENDELIKADFSKLTMRQKLEVFQNESPELKPLILDCKERLAEAKTVLTPFLNLSKSINGLDTTVINLIKMKNDLILHYCTNISFYLILKFKQEFVVTHSVIKRLAQYRHLLTKIKENESNLMQYVTKVLEVNTCSNFFIQSKRTNEGYNIKKSHCKNTIQSHKCKIAESEIKRELLEKRNSHNLKHENSDVENDNVRELNEYQSKKRIITYEMAENRGLTPYRRKELRNPRVKHRHKYRKAKICRRGAVREVRKETTRYRGEISGIKASISKSVKFK